MIDLLLVAAFTAHLIAVNVAAAGPLFCVALEWRGMRRGDSAILAIARRFAVLSLASFAAGVFSGAMLLAIIWYVEPSYWAAIRRVPEHRWWFFGGEIVFYLVFMVAYVWLWNGGVGRHVALRDADASLRHGESSIGVIRLRGRLWHRLLAIMAATNVLYHFPPLFTMLSLMSTRPELADATLDRSLYVRLFTDAETLARVAHHWLSSITTAGGALMLIAARSNRELQPETEQRSSDWATTFAARVALLATALQLPAGLWLLFASPAQAQSQLLGGQMPTTLLFATAIFAMVLLLQSLATQALGDGSRSTAIMTAALLLVVLVLMSYLLHRTRAQGNVAQFVASVAVPTRDTALRVNLGGTSGNAPWRADFAATGTELSGIWPPVTRASTTRSCWPTGWGRTSPQFSAAVVQTHSPSATSRTCSLISIWEAATIPSMSASPISPVLRSQRLIATTLISRSAPGPLRPLDRWPKILYTNDHYLAIFSAPQFFDISYAYFVFDSTATAV